MSSDDIYQQAKGGYVSDELLGTFLPIVVYWVYSGLYLMLGDMHNYRLHSKKDEDEKNLVSQAVYVVLFPQVVQVAVATVLFAVTGNDGESDGDQHASIFVLGRLDLCCHADVRYLAIFMHRYMHQNKFLYKHIHAQHHRLIVPYAFGALYNHPLEGLILDTIGGL
ncbi:Arf guanine nucleotide exchange factor sbh1 [Datura stramonium]|uniref:Arf guanine nucleotide exchange factor sbh1 n=1 Tax=Datura stramonium TaxID=4076 RepID=A0ABS8TJX9_DATST|nr:Arf guanine nucleotide exchange factor sbh1 [Datura stramonium]